MSFAPHDYVHARVRIVVWALKGNVDVFLCENQSFGSEALLIVESDWFCSGIVIFCRGDEKTLYKNTLGVQRESA